LYSPQTLNYAERPSRIRHCNVWPVHKLQRKKFYDIGSRLSVAMKRKFYLDCHQDAVSNLVRNGSPVVGKVLLEITDLLLELEHFVLDELKEKKSFNVIFNLLSLSKMDTIRDFGEEGGGGKIKKDRKKEKQRGRKGERRDK
jgi:hypothetical protein